MNLKDLMDPQFQEQQARYENARYAVSEAWKMAARNFNYVEDIKAYKLNEAGEKVRDYEKDVLATDDQVLDKIVKYARLLANEIEKDLNKTLTLLDKKEGHNGNSAGPSKNVGHS